MKDMTPTPISTSRTTARATVRSDEPPEFEPRQPQQPQYPPSASISLTADYRTNFVPHNHKKHRGIEPQINQFDVVNLQSDRDPDAVMERRLRRTAHQAAMARNPNCFKAEKYDESFASYMEAANIMKSVLGDSRQVRDTGDRCPPSVGYSYSRVPRPVDNRPDCYDFDDKIIMERTRGYAPGHVRSLSPPPRQTVKWLGKLDTVSSTLSFDPSIGNFTSTESSTIRQDPKLETRFASLTLSKDWSKYFAARTKEAKERKEDRRKKKQEDKDRRKITAEIRSSIECFEKNNISVIHGDSDDDL